MASILVTYGTGEGQTAKVADRIASVLGERGHDVTTEHVVAASTVDVEDFDAVLVGSPVNNRRLLPSVVEFVAENSAALSARPSGFFQLSLASIFPFDWAESGDRAYVESLAEETGWRPDRVGRFAGAIRYSQYDRFTGLAFRLVATLTTGDTDTSRDYEYTDWDAVSRFAGEFASFVEDRTAASRGWRQALPRVDRRGAAALGVAGVGLAGVAYWSASRRRDRGVPATAERAEARAGTEVRIGE